MCRLLGWVSQTPRTAAEVLGPEGLADLAALSRQHADGWGMAWWEGGHLRVQTSQQGADGSPAFAAALREHRSEAALLHLRWATPGIGVGLENTHPFLAGGWALGHNGAIRPADGLLSLLTDNQVAQLRGSTDSERLLHLLLARVDEYGLDEGLHRTVVDVCRELTPSSLNALLLGRHELTAICSHGGFSAAEVPARPGHPEEQPGYFDLCWRRQHDAVLVASQPLGDRQWGRLPNGTALILDRGGAEPRTVPIGTFPAAARARERCRRAAAAILGAP